MGGALYEDYGMHPQDAESCEYRQEELRMDRMVGTVSRGIRAPIIRQGDDLAKIVVDSVLAAAGSEPFEIRDKDVIAVTEAVVARAQGNYAHIDQIAADFKGL